MYESLGIDPQEKVIVYSDSQNPELAKNLKKQCDDIGIKRECIFILFFLVISFIPSFWGQYFTNL